MKKKFGTLLDEEVIRLLKRQAADEGRPLSDILQDALVAYLNRVVPEPKEREAAYSLFCERPFKLTRGQFRQVLEGCPEES